MNYIEIVNDAVQYIEYNLHRKLSLEELASRYYISTTYFYRIFRAVTNQTVKSYILGRKLSAAAIALKKTDRNVADIAFQHGFNSHEQFTRDFLKIFHITPSRYRKESIAVPLTAEMDIVERDFKNENNDIVVDYFCRELNEIKLLGKKAHFNPWNSCELEAIMGESLDFHQKYVQGRRLYNIVCGDPGDPSRIYGYQGIAEEEYRGDRSGLEERIIPASRYAVFRYPGSIGLVSHTTEKDYYKWLSVTKLKINTAAGIDYFTEDYVQAGIFYIHIPVL
ncbi:MAG: AraC family transcriptional regulator [Actinobacteria bacterium]|nr:AraC family transcriptional regulator [Actinomycetota bacterium]